MNKYVVQVRYLPDGEFRTITDRSNRALRFDTQEEAEARVSDLKAFLAEEAEYRVAPSRVHTKKQA